MYSRCRDRVLLFTALPINHNTARVGRDNVVGQATRYDGKVNFYLWSMIHLFNFVAIGNLIKITCFNETGALCVSLESRPSVKI